MTIRVATPPDTVAQDALARRLRTARRTVPASDNWVPRRQFGDDAPLSSGQERMWLAEQRSDGIGISNFTFEIRLRGPLDRVALEQAITELHRRHEILRTVYVIRAGVPHQRVLPAAPVALPRQDLRAAADPLAEARRHAEGLGARPYRLDIEPAIRWRLLWLGDDLHVLILCMHHAVADGWSEGLLRRELSALYAAYRLGQAAPLPALPVQYSDYAAWQRGQSESPEVLASLEAVRDRLADAPPAVRLPGGLADSPSTVDVVEPGGETLVTTLPPGVDAACGELAMTENVSPFMVMLAAFGTALARETGQTDLVLGAPVAGRTRPELESLIGFFVNTVALRVDLSGDPTFRELLGRVRESTLDAFAHQDLPFDRVVERLRPERVPRRPPLVQVLFQVDNTPDEPLVLPGLEVRWEQLFDRTSSLDLTVSIQRTPEAVTAYWEYRSALISQTAVRRLQGHFLRVLEAATDDPTVHIGRIPLLTDAERTQLLDWGTGPAASPAPFVQELIAAQARRQPDATAVVAGERTLSFGELDEQSDQLAARLVGMGIGPGAIVGLLMRRDLYTVTSLLAVLKAGGAYLPLDPAYPSERLRTMVEDALPAVLLCDTANADKVPCDIPRILVDRRTPALVTPTTATVRPDDIAYVIYTSGSTGRPKGTAVTHRSLANILRLAADVYPHAGAALGTLVHSSLGFDFTVTPLFLSLTCGKSITLLPEDDTLDHLAAALREPGIAYDWLKLTPSHLDALRFRMPRGTLIDSVRRIGVGGEQLRRETVSSWRDLAPHAVIVNEYGPTETTVFVTTHEVGPGRPHERVPIGTPVAGSHAYVLDARQELVPVGVVGDLHIGGDVVAQGYLGRPRATAERFVPDPFSGRPGARMYRTGDLTRWRDDGLLDCLGRIDDQVKVRGFRVELGEIEAVLAGHPSVREVVAAVDDEIGSERMIVAYWVREAEGTDQRSLREWLSGRLPDFMVPAIFQECVAIPLNAHGKVDRARLPRPATNRSEPGAAHVAPRDAREQAVAAVWATVLGVDRVGATDNFFALGGDSLSAGRMAAMLAVADPSVDVAGLLRVIFRDPVLATVASHLGSGTEPVGRIERRQRGAAPLPLSAGQRTMWFHGLLAKDSAEYLAPAVHRMAGDLDVTALREAVARVVTRHEVLRTGIVLLDGEPVGTLLPDAGVRFRVEDLRGDPEPSVHTTTLLAEELATPFDLARQLPVRALLIRCSEAEWVFALTLHHLASDAASMQILVTELAGHYADALAGRPDRRPPLPIQYADYAGWQHERIESGALAGQIDYWRHTLDGLGDAALPLDRPRPRRFDPTGGEVALRVDARTCAALRAIGAAEGTTLFTVLLAAYRLLLAEWSGRTDIGIGVPVSGRAAAGTDELIGMFINTVVFRARSVPGEPFAAAVRTERGVASQALAHQEIPFDVLVRELRPRRDLSRNPVFQVMYTHIGRPEPAPTLPGLTMEPLCATGTTSSFDLVLHTAETLDGSLDAVFTYSAALFDAATVESLATRFACLLTRLATVPSDRRPPTTTELLAEVWREVLEVEDVQPEDDFFDLGGHSLAAVKIVSRLEAEFGLQFPVTLLFEYPVFAECAEVLGDCVNGEER